MPLLPRPYPGDLADRQSILELKLKASNVDEFDSDAQEVKKGLVNRITLPKGSANPRTVQFVEEHQAILDMIQNNFTLDKQNDQVFIDKYDKLYNELSEINSSLWELEDKIRALKSAPYNTSDKAWLVRIMETAFEITDCNDRRAVLVKSISAMWNFNTQEKFY